ncbi:hypothetical protein GGU11DRAFT_231772 [Lentinula aff. detonsa]|nr:hypothetical protein GGU11DRAFT_231772 [Lentinula aff. detonsa]
MVIEYNSHKINFCRDWYQATVSLLYVDIAVYSIIQFCALAFTLWNTSSLARKVVPLCIRFCCHVPTSEALHNVVREYFINLLPSLCPHLTHISRLESFVYDARTSIERILPSFSVLYPEPDKVEAIAFKQFLQFPLLRIFLCNLDSQGLTFVTRNWKFPVLDIPQLSLSSRNMVEN